MTWLVQLVVAGLASGSGAAVVATPAAPDWPESLVGLQVDGRASVASDARGNVGVWDRRSGSVAVWSEEGTLLWACRPADPRLGTERGNLALRGEHALLTFMDHPAGNEDHRVAAILDVEACEVRSVHSLPGLVIDAAPSRTGWIVAISPDSLATPVSTFAVIGDRGETVRELDLHSALEALSTEGAEAGQSGGRVFALGDEAWVIPHAVYQLWRPAQRGRPFRTVEPPDCLAATATLLAGEENRQHVLKLISGWPEAIRERMQPAIAAGSGRLGPSYLAATAGVAVNQGKLAVVVRNPATHDADRLDTWDLMTELLVTSQPFPADARLVGVGDGFIWLRDGGGGIRRLELAQPFGAGTDTCAAIDARKGRSAENRRSPVPTPTPSAEKPSGR